MKNFFFAVCVFLASVLLASCGNNLPPHIAAQFATPTPTAFLPGPYAKFSNESPRTADDGKGNLASQEEVSFEQANDEEPWGAYPAPTLLSDIAIPAPMPAFELSDDIETIVILGSDQRPDDPSYRTDVILLLILDKAQDKATMVSVPRDLYVYQPGYKMDRINSAHLRGGADLIYLTFEYNFGLRPDHYVFVNFNGFSSIIDSLGGIQVQVPYSLTDHRDGYGDFTIGAGSVTMDAETALWYVRSRGTSNDYDRGRRQQEVLSGLFNSAFSLEMLANASDIYNLYRDNISTDISLSAFLNLVPTAGSVFDSQNIHRYGINEDHVDDWINYNGAFVLLPDRNAIQALLQDAID